MRLAMPKPPNAACWKPPRKLGDGGLAGAMRSSAGRAVVLAGGDAA